MSKKIYKAKVSKIERVSSSSHFIEIECETPVKVEAGQFISIYCDGLTLRRPFSVYSNNNGRIGVLFKERGKGTQYIKSLKLGDFIDIAGPFGNTFDIQNKKSLLIGAGIVTILELIVGIVVNVWLGLEVWDYSNLPFNFMGQICLPFSFAWTLLSGVAIVVDDYLRYWLFGEEKPHYKIL